ncbi:MAG: nitrogenase iron-molybdenum cofactor biosynthesis protein NifN [Alphaproteobacteria bacterium]|nr:MAG: nitrogenase iron-molybdenum cofactor biosynthesis protein NifN [Alphaproteobacteria bacterium]
MAEIIRRSRPVSVNPLKSSAPLGAAMAFLGVERTMPLFHGSQGCTAFGMVLLVRHFKEAIPLQTTALTEITAILGGMDNLEQAIQNLAKRAQPKLIGIATTGLAETRGEDFMGDLALIRRRNPDLANTALVLASTPDMVGGLSEGWAKAVTALIEQVVEPGPRLRRKGRVAVLPGSHITAGDIDELTQLIEAFGLTPVVVPDLSRSLDGHVPGEWIQGSLGGTTLEELRTLGSAQVAIALGSAMQAPAAALERLTGVPYQLFDRVTGLSAVDRLVSFLSDMAGVPAPPRVRRQRSQLLDAMLDGHFHFGGRQVALAGEGDLVWAVGRLLADLGAGLGPVVVPTTLGQEYLAQLPCAEVLVSDLGELEDRAAGCDLIIGPSHARQASERTGIPLFRLGFPIFDRLGAAHVVTAGYRGTRDLIFRLANAFQEQDGEAFDTLHTHAPREESDHGSAPASVG